MYCKVNIFFGNDRRHSYAAPLIVVLYVGEVTARHLQQRILAPIAPAISWKPQFGISSSSFSSKKFQ